MLMPVLLCLIGAAAIVAEFFIPSAGLIGISGLGVIIAAIVLVFRNFDSLYGFIFLAANVVIVPTIIYLYWKHFPRSFMGKRLILSSSSPAPSNDDSDTGVPGLRIGDEGVALTPLRPAGTALFGDSRISVMTDGEFLPKECRLRVIKVEGNRIFVEGVAEETENGAGG